MRHAKHVHLSVLGLEYGGLNDQVFFIFPQKPSPIKVIRFRVHRTPDFLHHLRNKSDGNPSVYRQVPLYHI